MLFAKGRKNHRINVCLLLSLVINIYFLGQVLGHKHHTKMFSRLHRNPTALFTTSPKSFRPRTSVFNGTLRWFARTVYRCDGQLHMLNRYPKWGFIIYRCDYRRDTAWKTFIEGWSAMTERQLRRDGMQHLMQTLEFTVKEDPGTLDGATVEQVREVFTKWRYSDEERAATQQALENGTYSYPRDGVCVRVDANALDRCLAYLALGEEGQKRLDSGVYSYDPDAWERAPYVHMMIRDDTVHQCETPISDEGTEDSEKTDEDETLESEMLAEEEEALKSDSVKMFWPYVLPVCYPDLVHNANSWYSWTHPYYSQTEEKLVVW